MEPPINKVGLCTVIVDGVAAPLVLLVQPKGKRADPNDPPPYVLPRGTRAYAASDGTWHDARTKEDAIAHAEALEPLDATMKREAEEEAGIPPALFTNQAYRELGVRRYTSPNKPPYDVYWGVLTLSLEDRALLSMPVDSQDMQWVTLAEFEQMVAAGTARAGYLEIARESISSSHHRH